jgi:hypothetical protein
MYGMDGRVGLGDDATSSIVGRGASKIEKNAERNVVAMKLASEYQTPFGYNPLFLMGIVAMPLVLQSLGISALLYLPLSMAGLSYLKADKDRQDRKSAVGIVSDYNVSRASLY